MSPQFGHGKETAFVPGDIILLHEVHIGIEALLLNLSLHSNG
ncbi:MAG: hypothetical protein QXH24_06995 [Candidatus Bathyarchaeia archaeon]